MSKELYPVGLALSQGQTPRPKLAAEYLLERMGSAGVREAFIILRPGKWDIPAYFGDGSSSGMRLAYLTVHVPYGVPFTLDQAFPFAGDSTIALGFPDILFWPGNAYQAVLQRLEKSSADVVLGLFPTDEPSLVGLVDFDERGRVLGIHEKSDITGLRFMWAIAAWRPIFSRFLHEFVERTLPRIQRDSASGSLCPAHHPEYPIGDIIHAAIQTGLVVEAEVFEDGRYIDIGTPRNLIRAVQQEMVVDNSGID
jgi:glucose-1-phosphate thymidylyltransferase